MITFPQTSTAYEAFNKLSTGSGYEISQAAIVERDKDGRLQLPDAVDSQSGSGLAPHRSGDPGDRPGRLITHRPSGGPGSA